MSDTRSLTKKDFKSDQEVRWCPGCGDYAILNAVQSAFAKMGMDRSNTVIVSGIGCSSRFPYYMSTYGFHTIHGRAPAIATGLKLADPGLNVWVVTGDGDALSIGGNHFIHLLRRNPNIKVLLFNNRIYGLTKGQYSPTSLVGHVTKSTPLGSVDNPFNPICLALGAGATFVARTVDVFNQHLQEVLAQAAAHKGTAFVEVFQNCNIFNDGAWAFATGKEERVESVLELQAGKPLLFGKEKQHGIRFNGTGVEVVELEDGIVPEDCIIWDPAAPNPYLAFMLAQGGAGELPTPIGVFRQIRTGTLEDGVSSQITNAKERLGEGNLRDLLHAGDVWEVG